MDETAVDEVVEETSVDETGDEISGKIGEETAVDERYSRWDETKDRKDTSSRPSWMKSLL